MAIKKYKPTTPGRRGMTVTDYSVLSKVDPERSLLESKKKHAGRNNTGKITVRHHGGGNRQHRSGGEIFAQHRRGQRDRRGQQQLIGFLFSFFSKYTHGQDRHCDQEHKGHSI